MIWASLLAWAGAFLINLLILPLVLRLAHRHKWYDRPDSRKIHTGLIPRMGGPGLFLSFILAVVLVALALPRLAGGRLLEPRLIALFGGMTIVHLVGLYDDFKNLPAIWKFVLQLAAAAIITWRVFLLFTFPPARIFMGASGSLFLGLTLAALPLVGGIPRSAAFGSLIVPVTLLTVPILDTATAILRRLRHRRSIISPDKQHIHHKLLAMGLSERQILTVIYGMCAYLALVSVTSVVLPKEITVYLIVVVWVGSLLGSWVLGYL